MENRGNRRRLVGVISSDKMTKTVVVTVTHRVRHEAYKKYVTLRIKYKAHDEHATAHMGDTVEIVESRPLSRTKRWRVSRILTQAEVI